jgi:hypothetical protein
MIALTPSPFPTGSLRAQLPPNWEFDYIPSPHETEPAAELKGVYPGPNYEFFSSYTPDTMSEAVTYLDEILADQEEPYDGIVGFSQGASVAASWLSRSLAASGLKFAVFLCAALVPPSKAGTAKALEESIGSLAREGEKLDLPTLHVIGERDLCFKQSERLVGNCEAKIARKVVVGGGGHNVPRDGAVCGVIARAVERVAFEGVSRQ